MGTVKHVYTLHHHLGGIPEAKIRGCLNYLWTPHSPCVHPTVRQDHKSNDDGRECRIRHPTAGSLWSRDQLRAWSPSGLPSSGSPLWRLPSRTPTGCLPWKYSVCNICLRPSEKQPHAGGDLP